MDTPHQDTQDTPRQATPRHDKQLIFGVATLDMDSDQSQLYRGETVLMIVTGQVIAVTEQDGMLPGDRPRMIYTVRPIQLEGLAVADANSVYRPRVDGDAE
jgi:hypothetical protein